MDAIYQDQRNRRESVLKRNLKKKDSRVNLTGFEDVFKDKASKAKLRSSHFSKH